MGKYIDHRLVARPEPDNTSWDKSTLRKLDLQNELVWLNTVNILSLRGRNTITRILGEFEIS